MTVVALNTGLRQGELLALRWKHVDLKLGQLVVCENDWRGVIGTPKGHRARVVPLNNQALAALRKHHHKRSELVFCHADGSRIDYHQCRGPLQVACKKAELKAVQWHGLRHSFGTHLAMRGVPLRAIQDLLGHATIEMTLRYAHNTPAAGRSAVDALDSDDGEPAARHGKLMANQNADSGKAKNSN